MTDVSIASRFGDQLSAQLGELDGLLELLVRQPGTATQGGDDVKNG